MSDRATETAAATGDTPLLRALGVWGLAAGIVNITIGGGIFGLPARVAAVLGSAAPIAYLVCAAVMALVVICIAEAGSRVALTGGPYAYIEVAFGRYAGFLAGVLLWLVGTAALAAVATLFAASVARLAPALAALGAGAPRLVLLASVFVLFGAVNVRGVRQGARLNTAMTIAKLAPLALLVVAGATAVRPAHLAWASAPPLGDVTGASVLLFFAFAGVESALVPSGEVREPARTVPRAIFIAMAAITALYLGVQVVAQGVLGPELTRAPDTPLADAAGRVLGPAGRTLLLVGAAVSMLGYVGGMTLAIPRALYAFARDGFLPTALARVHPRHHTPHVAIVTQCALALLLAASGTFGFLAVLASVAVLVLYFGCCVAAWRLRRLGVRAGGTPFRAPARGAVPALACLAILFLLSSLPLRELAVSFGVLTAASVLYAIQMRRRPAGRVGTWARAAEAPEHG